MKPLSEHDTILRYSLYDSTKQLVVIHNVQKMKSKEVTFEDDTSNWHTKKYLQWFIFESALNTISHLKILIVCKYLTHILAGKAKWPTHCK